MLGWALTFFILAVAAAALGFGGLAGTLAWAAKWLFFAFIILFIVTLVANIIGGRRNPPPL